MCVCVCVCVCMTAACCVHYVYRLRTSSKIITFDTLPKFTRACMEHMISHMLKTMSR